MIILHPSKYSSNLILSPKKYALKTISYIDSVFLNTSPQTLRGIHCVLVSSMKNTLSLTALKMETECASETSATLPTSTQCKNPRLERIVTWNRK
jgi:hypothetical protein